MTATPEVIYSLEEAADYLRIPTTTLVRLAKANKVASTKTGRVRTFRLAALDQYQIDHESTPLPPNPHGLSDASLKRVRS